MEGFISLGQGGGGGGGSSNSNDQMMMMMMMMGGSGGGEEAGAGLSSSSSVVSCEDCGNQAKKDCAHIRCRTCCRSRGFDCPTHLKSTWVPASVRRERQLQQGGGGEGEGQGDLNPKRNRRGRRRGCTTTTTTTNTSAGMEMGMNNNYNLPGEISCQALFKCVRVSSIDDTREEFAYQTSVAIGGHVFKGILYDQGPDHHHHHHAGPSTRTYMYPGDASEGMMTSGLVASSSSSPAVGYNIDQSIMYPVPLTSNYMVQNHSGTHFFSNNNPPRS